MVEAQTDVRPAGGTGRFLRHYLEMVIAMMVGMPIYGLLFMSPLDPLGQRAAIRAQPFLGEVLMVVAMTIPMVGYMAWRKHSFRQMAEMTAGMALPAFAVIWLTATGLVPFLTLGTLSLASHVAMLLGMLAAMWLRRDEYSGSHDHHAHGMAHG